LTTTPSTVRVRPRWAGRRWRLSAHGAALAAWVVAVGAAAAAVLLVMMLRRSGGPVPEVYLGNVWPALVLPGAGLLLVGRPPYRAVGWLFTVGGLGAGLSAFGFAFAAWAVNRPGLYGLAGAMIWAARWLWTAGMLPPLAMLLLPDGTAARWRRGVLIAAGAAVGVFAVFVALSGATATDPTTGRTVALSNPVAVGGLDRLAWPVLLVTFVVVSTAEVLGAGYLTWRWWRAVDRARSRLAVLVSAGWLVVLPWVELPVVGPWLDAVVTPVFAVVVAVVLLRNGEGGDLDVVVGRSYLWASLTTCVVAGYLLVVTLLAALLQRTAGASVAVAASGVVALLVAPLRVRLQRGVDRLLYGARADPYASIAALARRLSTSLSPDEVLPAVARTITEELRLPYAAFRLTDVDGDTAVAEYGTERGDLIALPVDYLGTPVGTLLVSTPGPGVALRPAERRLLTDLARQAGSAAHGVAALTELRRSRQRLVGARERERRSLRRELHDDLGAMLTGVAHGIDAATNRLPAGSATTEQLRRVRAVVSDAVDDLRRIIDGLRPPALDEVGLVAAVRDRVLRLADEDGPVITVDAQPLRVLPPEVEVACYHVAVEAAHNAVRHAAARRLTVTLTFADRCLALDVTDDGCGIGAVGSGGDGLTTMRQRVEEIGGRFSVTTGPSGTTVTATLPTGGAR
jgi:two-component system, NarL family, sensor kinase